MEVEVRTLTGAVLHVQLQSSDQTVRQLKAEARRQSESLAACRLFYKGRPLSDDTKLATLNIQPGTFLTAVALRHKDARPPPAAADPADPGSPVRVLRPHAPMPPSPGQLDSLLPGYLSRPNLSPQKGRQQGRQGPWAGARGLQGDSVDVQPALAGVLVAPSGGGPTSNGSLQLAAAGSSDNCVQTISLFEDLQHQVLLAAPEQYRHAEEGSSQPPRQLRKRPRQAVASTAATDCAAEGAPAPAPALPPDDAIVKLPLPAALRQSESAFGVAVAVHDFLARSHIQATWNNMAGTLARLGLGGRVTLADVHMMAALCPQVVSAHQHLSDARLPYSDAWRRAAPRSPGAAQRAVLSAAAAAEAVAGAHGGAIPHPAHVRTDGAGTVLGEDPAGSDELGDTVITFSEPWQLQAPPPRCFLEALERRKGQVPPTLMQQHETGWQEEEGQQEEQQQQQEEEQEEEEEDKKGKANSTQTVPQRRRSLRPNKGSRQAWAFKRAAVEVVVLLQERHLADNPPDPSAAVALSAPAAIPPPPKRSRRSKTGLGRHDAAALDSPQHASQTQASPSAAELLMLGRWHPAFPVETLPLSDIRAAAEELAAGKEAVRQAEVEEADALAAARALAVAGKGAGAPRPPAPPQLLKGYHICRDTAQLGTEALLAHLGGLSWYRDQICHVEALPARAARHAQLATPLPPAVAAALHARGVSSLFSHQVQAIDRLRTGGHTVIATATASGKSLCYNVPVLEALAADPSACALYMFPTKALAQDQLRALRDLCTAAFGEAAPSVDIYDGDTPMHEREGIRLRAQLLITNPDMLNQSVLPAHAHFSRLLGNLRFCVVDEAHTYKGVFGCHVALVIRRLRRLCNRVYHSSPTFVVTTATVANPSEHAAALLGVAAHEVAVVAEDGSPHGPKSFVLWNPPLITPSHDDIGGGGRGGKGGKGGKEPASGAKRAQRERPQEAGRQAGQERSDGGGGGADKAQAAAFTGAEAPPYEHASDPEPPRPPQMTAAEWRLAADAAAAISAATAVASRPIAAPQPGGDRTASTRPGRRLIKLAGHSADAALSNMAAAVPASASLGRQQARAAAQQAAQHAKSAQERLPSGRQWRERLREEGHARVQGTPSNARRRSPIVEISLLLAECVQHGLRTIAFCKTRKLCELVTAYVRETLNATAPHLAGTVAVYRAGYSPAERREIEAALFSGSLRAVAATNALELGVDIGGLDATLHLGFPGSVASLWQQAGRAGRREQPSLSIYVGWGGPLDQYFLSNPSNLFSRPIEAAMVDPSNPAALQAHVACAAAEAPLLADLDLDVFGPAFPGAVQALMARGLVGRHPTSPGNGRLHFTGAAANPAAKVSLRAIDPDRYCIINEAAGGAVLEEIEQSKAFYEVYDGAVYLFQGRTYLCKRLDLDARVALVRPADLKYYTKPIDFTDVEVVGGRNAFLPQLQGPGKGTSDPAQRLASDAAETNPGTTVSISATLPAHRLAGSLTAAGPSSCCAATRGGLPSSEDEAAATLCTSAQCGRALVTTRWLGFARVWRGSGQVFDSVDLFLPDVQYETEATYLRLPPSARAGVEAAGLKYREGVHAAAHALLNVLPLYMMCNANDVATECDNPYDTRFKPERILIYDKHPGGIGLAAAACPIFSQLLQRALALVRLCDCSEVAGCPSCCQHVACGEYNTVLSKAAAVIVLQAALEAEAQRHGFTLPPEVGHSCAAHAAQPT